MYQLVVYSETWRCRRSRGHNLDVLHHMQCAQALRSGDVAIDSVVLGTVESTSDSGVSSVYEGSPDSIVASHTQS